MSPLVDLRPLGEACKELTTSFVQVLLEIQHAQPDPLRLESLAEDLAVNLEEVLLNLLMGIGPEESPGYFVSYREETLNPDDTITSREGCLLIPGATSMEEARAGFNEQKKNSILVRYTIIGISEAE